MRISKSGSPYIFPDIVPVTAFYDHGRGDRQLGIRLETRPSPICLGMAAEDLGKC